MHLLLIEDNARLAGLIRAGIEAAGFTAEWAATGAEGLAAAAAARHQAVVLDLALPDIDGLEVLAALRGRGDGVPVLILTARDGIGDRVAGLNRGADDYLLKPFAMAELVARLRALLRRPSHALGVTLACGNLAFDTAGRQVRVDGVVIAMSRREMAALEQLMRRIGRVVPKAVMEEGLFGFDDEGSANSVEALVSRLRKRLQAAGADPVLSTVRGVGYLIAEP